VIARDADAAALAGELRRRLGPLPEQPDWPLVSVITLNRDGADRLRGLVAGLSEHTDYPRLELIVVDNGSSDESIAFARSAEAPFPISIVANAHNESFSDANNQGARSAAGELLLFANNDLEPFEDGWLRELVVAHRRWDAGAVGATLIYRGEGTATAEHGYLVQHRGMRFRDENGLVRPVLHGYRDEPLDDRLGDDDHGAIVAAACLLVESELFDRVGGFTHGFVYGAEDVDFSLKVRAAGGEVVCSGRSVIVHQPGSTRRSVAHELQRDRQLRNRRLLWERWGPRIRREHDLDLLERGERWAETPKEPRRPSASREEILAPGLCLKAGEDVSALAGAARDALARAGRRVLVVRAEDELEDLRWLNYDIAVHLRGALRFVPVEAQFNVLWCVSRLDELSEIEVGQYDLVLAGSEPLAARLRRADVSVPVAQLDPRTWTAESLLEPIAERFEASGFPTRIAR
jgi:GT2 family glycosyltransferase